MPDNQDDIKPQSRLESIRIWLLFASAMLGSFIAGYNAFDDVSDTLREHGQMTKQIPVLKDRILRLEILIGDRYTKKPTVYPTQENTGLINREG